jgi:hypothetical protein
MKASWKWITYRGSPRQVNPANESIALTEGWRRLWLLPAKSRERSLGLPCAWTQPGGTDHPHVSQPAAKFSAIAAWLSRLVTLDFLRPSPRSTL